MNPNKTSRLKEWLAACVTSATLIGSQLVSAQTWNSENILLPSVGYAFAGGGVAVLLDPFSDPANPGVLLGNWRSTSSGDASILRMTPLDPAFSAFTIAPLDSDLEYVHRLAHNPADGLYAVGKAPVDPKARVIDYMWKVRKSPAQNRGDANTWKNDDTFLLKKGAYSVATGITTDSQGNVYVSGMARDGRTPHWVVRRKMPGGVWATVYDGADTKGQNVNMIPAMCFFPGNANNPTPAVFTAGDLNSKWTVLRSQNQGAIGSWSLADSWPGGNGEASAHDVAGDSNGNIYVVGCRGYNPVNPSGWVVRMSQDGGNIWITLLDVVDVGASWAQNVAIDGAGNVSVSGVINPTAYTTESKPLWMVIRCTNPQSFSNWASSYANGLLPFGNSWSKGRGIAADSSGNVFTTGEILDWTDSNGTSYPGQRVGAVRLVPAP